MNNVPDALLAALFTFATASRVGIADITLLDTSFSTSVTTVAGVSLTWATLVALGTLAAAAALNSPEWSNFTQEQQFLVGLTVALVVGGTFLPQLYDSLGSNVLVALGAVGIEAGGYWAVAQSS
jgi:hypothetical protein